MEWQSTLNQETAKMQNEMGKENPLPPTTNILTQEANMQQVPQENMDMQTSVGDGGWDRR